MQRNGHIGCWLLVASMLAYLTDLDLSLFMWTVLLGAPFAILPDQDIKFGNHRGVTHSLLFAVTMAIVVGTVAWLVWGLVSPSVFSSLSSRVRELSGRRVFVLAGTPVLGGLLSHYLADVITLSGISLLWPKKKKYALRVCHSRSRLMNGALQMGGGVAFLIAFWNAVPH